MTLLRKKNLPADARREVTVEAVDDLAGTLNPGDITTAAIAKHMQLAQGARMRADAPHVFAIYRRGITMSKADEAHA